MSRRPLDLALSLLGWLGFGAVTAWTTLFLVDSVVPRTVDGPSRVPAAAAVAIDLALLGLFALQHSVMARGSVKARMRRAVPARLERTVFVLATDACLVLMLLLWQPFGGRVWDVDGLAAGAAGTSRTRRPIRESRQPSR